MVKCSNQMKLSQERLGMMSAEQLRLKLAEKFQVQTRMEQTCELLFFTGFEKAFIDVSIQHQSCCSHEGGKNRIKITKIIYSYQDLFH